MSNLFDFSDSRLSWRNVKGFQMELQTVVNNSDAAALDDEEDWFFPQPSISVPEDITAPYKENKLPVLPPTIYFSGMELNCNAFERRKFVLPDFDSYDDFINAIGKHLYISVMDADNCDFEDAQLLPESEEVFEKLVDNYRSHL